MKIHWGLLPMFVGVILGALFLFSYRGPHEELAFLAFFALIFLTAFWNGWRNALLKRRLQKVGLAGTARLLRTETTGTSSGNDPELRLFLSVTGQGGEIWEASVCQIIPQSQLYMMAPGTEFSVLYDPSDKSKIVLDTQQRTSQPSASQPSDDTAATARAYQEMIAKQDVVQKRLAVAGLLAPAKVISCAPLHVTMNHRDPLVMLMLEVQPENEAAFMAQMGVCLDVTRLDRFAPGCLVYVRYDASDKSQVALVGSEKPG